MLIGHVRNSLTPPPPTVAIGLLICALMGGATSTAPRPQQDDQPPPGARPTFRAGVDAIAVDVTVLDRSRRPIRGLPAEAFTVFENGQPQPIVSFDEIVVPPPVEPTASWTQEVASDVVATDTDTRRLVVIVMDDGYTGIDFGEPRSVRLVAHAIVDQLGPADMAAVVYTFMGRSQNFTADRAQLRSAIEAFAPKNWGAASVPLGCALRVGGCAVNALTGIAEVLATAPPGRKLVMFISPGIGLGRELAVNPDSFSGFDGLREMFQDLQVANATVYGFDPRGLMVGAGSRDEVALAEATGGRRIRNTNDPELHVPDVFRENGSYYLIGYQSTHAERDGRFRRIRVTVNRPDVTVQTRTGYFAPGRRRTRAASVPAREPLDAALEQGLPGGDLSFRLSTAVLGMPERREAAVLAVTGIPPCPAIPDAGDSPSTARTCQVEVVMAAFDTSWRSRGVHRQTLELTATGGARDVDVISHVRLAPGRYELRLAAESGGRTGRVLASIDVPDFAREPLSLSGVMVGHPPAVSGTAEHPPLPVTPGVGRVFTSSDQRTAFVRLYQDRRRPPAPVTVSSTVTSERDVVVATETVTLDAERFKAGHSADYLVDLPLARLTPGEYLLSIVASAGEHQAERRLRFAIRP